MSKLIAKCCIAVAVLSSVVACAAPSGDYRMHSCREDNRRTHAEVMEMFHRAHSAGRISPSEAQQFSAMEGRLNRHRDMLARDGLTPQECQYLSRELANERAMVQRMAASPAHDPRLHQCRLDNQRAHGEVMGMFHRARSAGRISPAEAQHFRAMEGRMNNHRAALAQDGLTLQECQHLGREIARERNEVQRMTFSPR